MSSVRDVENRWHIAAIDLMAEATERNWTVISMKNDWKRVFSFEK